jgi:hypothetical protein
MTAEQSNKMTTYENTEVLLVGATETSGVAGLPTVLAAFRHELAGLRALAGIQGQVTRGQTAVRDQMLEAFTDKTLEIAGIVGTYAHAAGLPELSALVDVTRGDINATRLVQRPLLAQRVHDAAAGVLSQLAGFGLTAETLTAFQQQIEAMRANANLPRQKIADRTAVTKEMAAAFRKVDGILVEQIDRLLLPLEKTDPGFHARYQAARRIIGQTGSRSAQSDATQPGTNATTAVTVFAPAAATSPVAEQKAA